MRAHLSLMPFEKAGKNSSALPLRGCTAMSSTSNLVAPPVCMQGVLGSSPNRDGQQVTHVRLRGRNAGGSSGSWDTPFADKSYQI